MYYDSLVIGGGEVGTSIKKVLDLRNDDRTTFIIDKKDKDFKEKIKTSTCKTLHVCIPYSNNFEKQVLKYCQIFKPELVIIHSTIAVGTTESLNVAFLTSKVSPIPLIAHSPVRGQHPNMEKALLLFQKYVGTDDDKTFNKVKKELSNIKLTKLNNSRESELGKLLSTSYYGICIAWHREMNKLCNHFNVDFKNVVTDFNITYNEGYSKLRPNVIRPVLTPPSGKIGGHCVRQNAKLLKKQKQSVFLDLIK